MTRRGFTTIISNPASGGASNIPTPMLAFVDNVNGNNSTAVFGRMDKPFATLNAAYAAGVASGQPFGCVFMPSASEYVLTLSAHLSSNCWSFAAHGCTSLRESRTLVRVTILAGPAPVQNADGLHALDGTLEISNLWLQVNATGGGVIATENNNSHTAGNGGNWTISGIGMVGVSVAGGSRLPEGGGESTVTAGNGGAVVLSGPLVCVGVSINAGSGDAPASNGTFAADGCDLRLASIPEGDVTLGRCAYSSAMIIVTNNKGGNADYV